MHEENVHVLLSLIGWTKRGSSIGRVADNRSHDGVFVAGVVAAVAEAGELGGRGQRGDGGNTGGVLFQEGGDGLQFHGVRGGKVRDDGLGGWDYVSGNFTVGSGQRKRETGGFDVLIGGN